MCSDSIFFSHESLFERGGGQKGCSEQQKKNIGHSVRRPAIREPLYFRGHFPLIAIYSEISFTSISIRQFDSNLR